MNPAHLIDTHCHIGAYGDPISVVRAAESTTSIVAVTESPEEYRRLRTRLGRRDHIQVALGLHPLRSHTFTPNDLARFFRLVPETTWIGEVGLDFSKQGRATKKDQLRIFSAVLAEAQPGQHPLTVHSRGAEADTIGFLGQSKLSAVLHWYTGPTNLIDAALAAGLYFSYNIAMVRSKKFSELVRAIPRDRTLLETDGPFARGQHGPARPHQLEEVVSALALGWDVSHADANRSILDNQRRFLAQTAGRPYPE
ncbi:TatD family deoxyribonuclease [Nocardioides oleivorans]|uniref:TatD family deoxyribonuclease n=1 Tax=Nocardioides oleivorans TaxID=273676 RepID=A0A4Q2S218_9ACTN|nr:TatD family hydrolase [Nocardioides oleivorans]RYB94435.1 TatD family deoxyribonuclease [Nocardioides oleivorans]